MASGPEGLAKLPAALAKAFHARRLYPPVHPQVRQSIDGLAQVANELRLRYGNQMLRIEFSQGRIRLGTQLEAALDQPGASSLLDRAAERGITLEQMHVAELSARAASLFEKLLGTEPATQSAKVPDVSPAPAELGPSCVRLAEIWGRIHRQRQCERAALAKLVATVASASGDGVLRAAELPWQPEGVVALTSHAVSVARLLYLAGRARGMCPGDLESLVEAGLLCDIGMLEIPEELWNSARTLRSNEFRRIRQHPLDGSRILLATPQAPLLAAVLAFEHHRRRGGQGYPQVGQWDDPSGLAGLVQVADAYAALRSPRRFRDALDEKQARDLLSRQRDVRLEGDALDLLLVEAVPAGVRVSSVAASPAPVGPP